MGQLIKGMSDIDYHELKDKDHHYSSSQLKDALTDIEYFHKKYIKREIASDHIPAFDIGTYFHMALLEPHRLATDVAVWMGARRAGKEWEAFAEANKKKTIITASDLEKAEILIQAARANPILMGLIHHDEAMTEVSIFTKLMGVPIKVRYDLLVVSVSQGVCYGLDLKSTTGNCKNEYEIRGKVSSYQYDLSAALYLDALNQHFKEIASPMKIEKFYWGFASKDIGNSQVYCADSDMIKVGRMKYRKAISNILDAQKRNWAINHSIVDLGPAEYEREWLRGGEMKEPENRPIEAETQGSFL